MRFCLSSFRRLSQRARIPALLLTVLALVPSASHAALPPQERCQYIDTKGSVAIPLEFIWAQEFVDGQAPVKIWCYDKLVFVDRTGKLSVRRKPVNGRAFKLTNEFDGCGIFVDKQGKRCFPLAPYEVARPFSDGLSLLSGYSGLKWAYADKSDQLKVVGTSDGSHAVPLEDPHDFHEGLSAVKKLLEGTYGYVDTSGAFAIAAQFKAANDFHDGLARVSKEESEPSRLPYNHGSWDTRTMLSKQNADAPMKYGFIGHDGTYVIQPQFDDAGDFHDGLAPVLIKGKWGYIDKTGKIVIEPKFSQAAEFREGRAAVYVQPNDAVYPPATLRYFYIDTSGKQVIVPEPRQWITDLGRFSDGLAVVEQTIPHDSFPKAEQDLVSQLIKAIAESWQTGYVSDADKAFDRAQVLKAIRISKTALQPALRAQARSFGIIEDNQKPQSR